MSWLRYMTLASFRHSNPEWRIQLHRMELPPCPQTWSTLETQDFAFGDAKCNYISLVPALGVEVVDWPPPCDVPSPIHASDIFQWQVLSTTGGVYCDMDILFTAPITSAIRGENDTYVCLFRETAPIGLLAACPRNRFYADVFRTALERIGAPYQSAGCEAVTATIDRYDTFAAQQARMPSESAIEKCRLQAIKLQHPAHTFKNLDCTVIYPFWWDRAAEEVFTARHTTLPAGCVGVHWYAGSPVSQQANQVLNHANFMSYSNTLSYFAAKVSCPQPLPSLDCLCSCQPSRCESSRTTPD